MYCYGYLNDIGGVNRGRLQKTAAPARALFKRRDKVADAEKSARPKREIIPADRDTIGRVRILIAVRSEWTT